MPHAGLKFTTIDRNIYMLDAAREESLTLKVQKMINRVSNLPLMVLIYESSWSFSLTYVGLVNIRITTNPSLGLEASYRFHKPCTAKTVVFEQLRLCALAFGGIHF